MDLGAAEVPGREHEVVARDDLEHLREPVLRQLHRRARDAGRGELVLDLAPDRLLRGLGPVLARLVLGVDRRQPDDPRAFARRDLDRLRVQPADAGVERDRAERVDARHRRAHDGRSLGRRHVVRLEHEARQPELGEAAREPEVVDAPLREIRLDVDVQVVGAADELARARPTAQWPAPARSSSSSGTGGVPLMWNEATVCIPHAWPFARSACDQTTASWSGSKIRKPPAQTSIRFPPGS